VRSGRRSCCCYAPPARAYVAYTQRRDTNTPRSPKKGLAGQKTKDEVRRTKCGQQFAASNAFERYSSGSANYKQPKSTVWHSWAYIMHIYPDMYISKTPGRIVHPALWNVSGHLLSFRDPLGSQGVFRKHYWGARKFKSIKVSLGWRIKHKRCARKLIKKASSSPELMVHRIYARGACLLETSSLKYICLKSVSIHLAAIAEGMLAQV